MNVLDHDPSTPARPPAATVLVTRAEGHYEIEIWPDEASTVVRCRGLGVTVSMTAELRRDIGASLLRAADAMSGHGFTRRHLRSMGSWALPVVEAGTQRIDLDAVRDDRERVSGVLISIDGMALDGYLDAHAARAFGEALLSPEGADRRSRVSVSA